MRAGPGVRWWAPGDWNAFFGLALDNLSLFVIFSGLLIGVFGFPSDLVLRVMVPGTAFGVLLGDLVSIYLAALRGVDPGPVKVIDELKAALAKR